MKIALNLLKIFMFIFALYILTQNSGQYVDINFINTTFSGVNLLIVILISLTVGAVLGAVFMAFAVIQSRTEVKTLRDKNRQLIKELENLRNISIDEIPDEELPAQLPASTSKSESQ